jgi:hypothetical protein
MAVQKVILDNRVHRTVPISTDAKEYNLVPHSPYDILLKVIDGKDTLVVSKEQQAIAELACTNTYPPQQCPAPITEITNPNCQFELQIDDTMFRVVELQQNLIDSVKGTVMLLAETTAKIPATMSHKLLYEVGPLAMAMDDGGFKVPPQLGL